MADKRKCPKCGRAGKPTVDADLFWCGNCKAFFDNDPDEGGTHSDRNAAARLEREDRARQQALDRLGRRGGR